MLHLNGEKIGEETREISMKQSYCQNYSGDTSCVLEIEERGEGEGEGKGDRKEKGAKEEEEGKEEEKKDNENNNAKSGKSDEKKGLEDINSKEKTEGVINTDHNNYKNNKENNDSYRCV